MKQKNTHELNFQWYIVTVVSGNEDTIVANLWSKIKAYGYENKVEDIKVIKEKKVNIEFFSKDDAPSVIRNSKNITWETIEEKSKVKYKKTKVEEKNKFNGYIFIKCIMEDEIWFIIRNTQMVTGIIGSSGKNSKPIPVSSEEITRILNPDQTNIEEIKELESQKGNTITNVYKTEDAIVLEKEEYSADFDVGSEVRVILEGAMFGEIGCVAEMNSTKGIATVQIEFFGRTSDVEIKYSDLELVH